MEPELGLERPLDCEVIGPTLVGMEDRGEFVGGEPRMAVSRVPPPPGICEKRLQAIENKGRECEKESQEKTRGGKHLETKDLQKAHSSESRKLICRRDEPPGFGTDMKLKEWKQGFVSL